MDQLTDDAAAILDFERHRWRYPGAKETAIRDTFAISATTYYQRLNALIDTDQALAADPMTVRRLRRLRDARAWQRDARRLNGLGEVEA